MHKFSKRIISIVKKFKIINEIKLILQIIFIVMRNKKFSQSKYETRKVKTLCTIETNDADVFDNYCIPYFRKVSLHRQTPKQKTMQSTHKKSKSIDYSKSKKSYPLKAQHSKSTVYYLQQQYFSNQFIIIRQIASQKEQQIYLTMNKSTQIKCLIRQTKDKELQRQYQKQIYWALQLQKMQIVNRKNIFYVSSYQKINPKITLVYPYGTWLNLQNISHLQLVRKSTRDKFKILKHIIKQVTKAIDGLSRKCLVHGNIKLQNVVLQLQQSSAHIKMQKVVRVCNFSKTFKIINKKSMLKMQQSVYTAPQIINYMIFECSKQGFDRQMIENIINYDEAWRIDMWSLGIMILEFLMCKQSFKVHLSLKNILQYQKNILSSNNQQLKQYDQQDVLFKLLYRMLSFNPIQRPHPKQLIYNL